MPVLSTELPVRPDSALLRELADERAAALEVPSRALWTQLLLHLPRLADEEGRVTTDEAEEEAHRLARVTRSRIGSHVDWMAPPPPLSLRADDLRLAEVSEAAARTLLERFHYLASFRPASRHFGGLCGPPSTARIAALLTVSRLDVPTLADVLPDEVDEGQVAVLARVFSFDWAPPNSLSYLMGRLSRRLREDTPHPRLLLTYLNPNLGFTGASYRASNWLPFGLETGTRYAYLDGDYVTDRALSARFGTSDPAVLRVRIGERIAFSRMSLKPLELWAYPLDARLRALLSRRPPPLVPHPRG